MKALYILFCIPCFCLLISCGSKSPISSNSLTVSVSSGTTPTYSWTGGGAAIVSVIRTSQPAVQSWGLVSVTFAITSPVTHGTVPNIQAVVESSESEKVLTPGVEYLVTVDREIGPASAVFIP